MKILKKLPHSFSCSNKTKGEKVEQEFIDYVKLSLKTSH